MDELSRRHINRSSDKRRRFKLDLLPFKSANPGALQEMAQSNEASSDSPTDDFTSKFSTIPGRVNNLSPMRARTMKEYDQEISELKKENFNLKLRIYFLEEKMTQKYGASDDHLLVYKENLELKVETNSLKKKLSDKHELLTQASGALEVLEKQHKVDLDEIHQESQSRQKELEDQIEQLKNEMKVFGESEPILNLTETDERNELIQKLENDLKISKTEVFKRNKAIQGLLKAIKTQDSKNSSSSITEQCKDFGENNYANCSAAPKSNSTSFESKTRVQELKSIIESLEEEAKKASEVHKKICTQKDSIIEQLHESISKMENILQDKVDDTHHIETVKKLEKRISSLSNAIDDKDMQLEELKCEKQLCNEDKEEKVSALEDKIKKLVEDLNIETQRSEKVNKSLESSSSELKSVNLMLSAKDQEISHLNDELVKASDNLIQITKKHENKILNLNEELNKLENDLQNVKGENKRLDLALKEKENEANDRDRKKLGIDFKITMLTEKNQSLMLENQNMKDSLKKDGLETKKLKIEVDSLKREIYDLNEENETMKNQLKSVLEEKDIEDEEIKLSIKDSSCLDNKLHVLNENLAIAEDTVYAQNKKIQHYVKLLERAGIDPSREYSDSIFISSQLIGSPPEKLISSSGQNFESLKESHNDQLDSLIQLNRSLPTFDSNRNNCKKHMFEIKDLQARLSHTLDCYEMVKCRLEEIADFLERLLNYDSYNGQLTPQQVKSLKTVLADSRNLTQSMSSTLHGTILDSADCSVFKSTISCNNEPSYTSIVRSPNFHKTINSKAGQTIESIELCRKSESIPYDGNAIFAEIEASANQMPCNRPATIGGEDVGVDINPNASAIAEDRQASSHMQYLINIGDSTSDSDAWSLPDRNVSLQRIGLDTSVLNPPANAKDDYISTDSNTATEAPRLAISFQGYSKNQSISMSQLENKLLSLKQLNDSLKAELNIYRKLVDENAQKKLNDEENFVSNHMQAIRMLHEKLEQNIKTNEVLRQTIGDQNLKEEEKLSEQIKKLKEEILEQEKNYRQLCLANSELQEKFIKKCQEVDSQKISLVENQEQVNNYEKVITSLQSANENFQTHTQKLTHQLNDYDKISKQNVEFRKRLSSFDSKFSQSKNIFEEKEKELKQVQDWNLRLQEEIQSKDSSLKSLEASKSLLDETLVNKDNLIHKLREELVQIQETVMKRDENILKLKEVQHELKEQLTVNSSEKNKCDKRSESQLYTSEELSKIRDRLKWEHLTNKKLKIENKELLNRLQKSESRLSHSDCHKSDIGHQSLDVENLLNLKSTKLSVNRYGNTPVLKELGSNDRENLDARVARYLESDYFSDSRTASSFNAKSKENSISKRVSQEIASDESLCEGILQRRSIHYSSPDLGIESDPNNHDSTSSYSAKKHSLMQKLKSSSNLKTDELKNIIVDNCDDDGHLYVMCPLMPFELLKREVFESLLVLGGITSRIKDRLQTVGSSSSTIVEESMMRTLNSSCRNLETCLVKSNELLLNFPIFDISTLRHNIQESSSEMLKKNQSLEDELKKIKMEYDKKKCEVEEIRNEISIAKKKKKGFEKAVTKQLQKTNSVLHQAKTNLQQNQKM